MFEKLTAARLPRYALLGLFLLSGCGENQPEAKITKVEPVHYEPSRKVDDEIHTHEDIQFDGIRLMAAFFACNDSDIWIEPVVGGDNYDVLFEWSDQMNTTEAVLFASNVNVIVGDYADRTGDESWEAWYPEFRDFHTLVSDDPDLYCDRITSTRVD